MSAGSSVLVRTLAAAPDYQLVKRLLEPPCDATGDKETDEHLAAVFALLVAARLAADPLRARLELLWTAADDAGKKAAGEERYREWDAADRAERLRHLQMILNRWATELGGAASETAAQTHLLGTSQERPSSRLGTGLPVALTPTPRVGPLALDPYPLKN